MSKAPELLPLPSRKAEIPQSAWLGNIVEPGEFLSDGHTMFRGTACRKKLAGFKQTGDWHPPNGQSRCQEIWNRFASSGHLKLKAVGYFPPGPGLYPHSERSIAVLLDRKRQVWWVDLDKLRLLMFVTGCNEFLGSKPDEPIGGLRNGKPKGLLMPLNAWAVPDSLKQAVSDIGRRKKARK